MSARLKAVGWSVLFLLGGYALAIAILIVIGNLTRPAATGSLGEAAIQSAALLAGYGGLTWLIGAKALHLPRGELLGAPGQLRRWRWFAWGLGLGAGLAALVMLIAVPLGHADWRGDGGTLPQWLATVLVTALVMLPAALAEELAFRGVPLVALANAFGRIPAVVMLGMLFSYAHAGNPGVSRLALLNIALAGIFLAFAFFTPGRLWTSTGAHLGWNLAIAALAAPVSGIPLPMPWLDYAPGSPSWLTGGGFGPEGGILATLGIAAGAALAARRIRPVAAEGTV